MTTLEAPLPSPATPLSRPAAAIDVDPEHEGRWEAWMAKGRLHDRRLRRRMRWLGSLVVASGLIWSIWAFGLQRV